MPRMEHTGLRIRHEKWWSRSKYVNPKYRMPTVTKLSVHSHRGNAPSEVPTAVITISDTRTLSSDSGGALVSSLLRKAGHRTTRREVVPDNPEKIHAVILEALEEELTRAVITTGGTGIAPRDVTPETIRPLFDREVPGFGEIFRMLSYSDIGSASILSRAIAGIRREKVIVALPGSKGAIGLAMERLVVPELGHLVGEATKR